MEKNEYYTPNELASTLRVSRQAIYKWIKKGRIRAVRVGEDWRIPAEEYERVKEEGVPPKEHEENIIDAEWMSVV